MAWRTCTTCNSTIRFNRQKKGSLAAARQKHEERCLPVNAPDLKERVAKLLAIHSNADLSPAETALAGNAVFDLANLLTRELTAAESFNDLLSAFAANGYRPTIRPDLGMKYEVLADLYDYAQARRGTDVKAFRG
jgi:hypothetical protein